jgi:hypothetical protein
VRQAQFTFAIARHALVDLSQVYGIRPESGESQRLGHEAFLRVGQWLADCGHGFADPANAEAKLGGIRRGYEPIAEALGLTLALELSPWLPPDDAVDDWQVSPWGSLAPF